MGGSAGDRPNRCVVGGQDLSPAELCAARTSLGLSRQQLADALRLPKWGFQSVGDWENGTRPIPGPVQVALELMLQMAAAPRFVTIPRLK